MIRRVKLYARVNLGGTFKRIPVGFDKNGHAREPKTNDGSIVSYAVRIAGRFEHAGDTLPAAVAVLHEKQALIGTGTVERPAPTATQQPDQQRTTIADAVQRFVVKLTEDVETGKKAKGTLSAYQKAVSDFRDTCGVTYLDEITETVLLNHLRWLRKNLKRRHEEHDGHRVVKGHAENTLAARFRNLEVFGTFNGIKLAKNKNPRPDDTGLIAWADVPRTVDTSEEKKMKGTLIFSDDELTALLSVATVDEADLIHFALKTGFRVNAIAAAEWSDVDWNGKTRPQSSGEHIPNIMTGPKQPSEWLPEGFRPKTMRKTKKFHQIEIPSLVERLRQRRDRLQAAGVKSTLIFANGGGRIHTGNGLLDKINEVVSRARAKGLKISGAIGAHRFRKTFGTAILRAADIATASMLLDHASITTTMLYLGVDRSAAAKALQTAFQTFE